MLRVPVLVAVAIIACALIGAPAHAQTSTPEPSLPAATAPLGLGTVMLPDDTAGVADLFARLPATIAGEPRVEYPEQQTDRMVAAYGTLDPDFGPPLTLQALNFATGDFFPTDFTAADFVASAAGTTDYDAVAFGQDGTLVWVRAETMAGVAGNEPGTPTISRTISTLAWGEASSSWLFTAAAFSPEEMEALVSAFVATAQGAPGTPAADATPLASWRQDPRTWTGDSRLKAITISPQS